MKQDASQRVESRRIFPDDWLHPLPLERWFRPGAPLEVDVGCGKGRFLLARASRHPDTGFLGIDRMLRRIRKVDNKATRRGLANVRLLRLDAYYAVTYLLPPLSVNAFYIFFPDPWPKRRHHDNRFFNPLFLDSLHRTLRPGGQVHFSTDHAPFFSEVRALLAADPRLEVCETFVPDDGEQTDFERYYVGRTEIGRCSFRKKAESA